MRKILFLLCALLTTMGVWATDVTVIDKAKDATTYGSLSGTTFTTNDVSGLDGVTIEGIKGTTATTFAYGACLALTNTASGTITMTAPDGYIIMGYSLTARSNTYAVPYTLTPSAGGSAVTTSTGGVTLTASGLDVQTASFTYSAASANSFYIPALTITLLSTSAQTVNVTYELWEGDSKITEKVEVQEANSAVNVPSSWTSSPIYSYTITGEIGDEDCTIKVIRTQIGVITTSDLSNSKCYTIRTYDRGWWVVPNNGTQVTSTTKASLATSATDLKQQFAFVYYDDTQDDTNDGFYLYSVSEKKFISKYGNYTTLTTTPGDKVTLLASSGNSNFPTVVAFNGTNHAGISNGYNPAIITHYNDIADGGNRCAIIEAADFNAVEALAAIEEYFHPAAETQFNTAISTLEAINWGSGVNQYSLTGEAASYAGSEAAIISGLKAQGYSEENLTVAQTLLANYALNMPSAGFYRIKGNTSNKYLAAGFASNNKFAMSDATDATTIFYFDGNILVNYGSGKSNGMKSNAWAWVTEDNASIVTFQDGLTNGGYAIKSSGAENANSANFYDNGDGTNSADRGGNVTINSGTNTRYTSWYLEEVTTLPVTISNARYATLYAPVALTIPNGVEAYTGVFKETWLALNAVENAIPANTPVVLKLKDEVEAGTYNFTVTTADAFSGENVLQGILGGIADATGKYVLANPSDGIGFYKVEETENDVAVPSPLAGFKAYLNGPAASNVKGFTFKFEDDATSIDEALRMKNEEPGAIYNLAGQRLNKGQKGINIVNGKKILK